MGVYYTIPSTWHMFEIFCNKEGSKQGFWILLQVSWVRIRRDGAQEPVSSRLFQVILKISQCVWEHLKIGMVLGGGGGVMHTTQEKEIMDF